MTNAIARHGRIVSPGLVFLSLAFLASGCATPPREVPTWGGTTPPVVNAPQVTYTAPPVVTGPQGIFSNEGRTTFTQGCTGSFSVRDARTNQPLSSGRAFNSGRGLIALDARGRQTRAISSASGQSVTFLPDCNCRVGGNQSSEMPATHQFAATAPSVAICAAS